jgi:[protein-PII] uridylyltransferase
MVDAAVLAADKRALDDRLRAMLDANRDGIALGIERAKGLEALLARVAGDPQVTSTMPAGAAIIGVGTFGRGALPFASDLDLRLVVPKRADRATVQRWADAFLYPIWDAKITLGHQVTTFEDWLDLGATDLASATACLDARVIFGSPDLARTIAERAWPLLFENDALGRFIDALEGERSKRGERFGGSVYLLEPDVKAGGGGLRDVDIARWALGARHRVGPIFGTPAHLVWGELLRQGVLVEREVAEFTDAEELHWRIRNRLHAHAGRRNDRLTFDAQEAIGEALGFAPEHIEDPVDRRALAAESLMQAYYRKAHVVSRACERILDRVRPRRRRGKPVEAVLEAGIRRFDNTIAVDDVEALQRDPALAIRVVAVASKEDAPMSSFTRDAISRLASEQAWCERLRQSPEAARGFLNVLSQRIPVGAFRGRSALGELHELGLLLAMVPEFEPVTGRSHHDIYHVYTVDVHSVAAVDRLAAVCRGELGNDFPLASRIALELGNPRVLFCAALLHDIGKGYPDKTGSRLNHAAVGARLAEPILQRFGLDSQEIADVAALIDLHLEMYHTATRRDLDDPATAEALAERVVDRERLRNLFLLTIVDVSTTSPTALTQWKARMLDDLYAAADAVFEGHPREKTDATRRRRIVQSVIEAGNLAPEAVENFLRTMPDRYLLANDAVRMAAHARLEEGRMLGEVRVSVVDTEVPGVAEVCVLADDAPGLLARIAAVITAQRLDVLAAQIHSRVHDASGRTEALDLFWVTHRLRGDEGLRKLGARIVEDLSSLDERTGGIERWLQDKLPAGFLERPTPAVRTRVVVDDRASPKHTVIEVFARDRPGLLFALAHCVHALGLTIASSKINTEGHQVADVFYVSDANGEKITEPGRVRVVRDRILAAVERTQQMRESSHNLESERW